MYLLVRGKYDKVKEGQEFKYRKKRGKYVEGNNKEGHNTMKNKG